MIMSLSISTPYNHLYIKSFIYKINFINDENDVGIFKRNSICYFREDIACLANSLMLRINIS